MNNASRNTENKHLHEYTFPVLLCKYLYVKLLSRMATQMAQMIKNPPAVRETPRFDPWVRKIPGRRHGNPLHYSCLENSIPGRIQSVGSGGVGHEGSNLAHT